LIVKNGDVALPGKKDFQKLDLNIDQGKIVQSGEDLPGNNLTESKMGYILYG